MTAHPAPYSLTIAAHAVANLRGHTAASLRLPVTDSGTRPVSVTMHVANVTVAAQKYPGAGWVRSITPHVLSLRPGQTRWFTLHVRVPPGARGDHVANFIAQARPVSTGQVSIGQGVGGTLVMRHAGHVPALAVHGPALITHAHGGPGLLAVIGGTALVALIAFGVAAWWLRMQRRHA